MELREICKGKKHFHLRYSTPLQNSPIISKVTSINQFASILKKEKTLRYFYVIYTSRETRKTICYIQLCLLQRKYYHKAQACLNIKYQEIIIYLSRRSHTLINSFFFSMWRNILLRYLKLSVIAISRKILPT